MKKITLILSAATMLMIAATGCGSSKNMNQTKMVGGAEMYPTKNIVENAANSKDHTTLVAAVKAAGLVETLSSPGPFTVFAPTDAAFEKLPEGTVAFLLKPENKPELTKILTYHVVAGKYDAKAINKMIRKGGGTATFTTVEGTALKATKENGGIYLTDALGNKTMVTIGDVYQSNGVIHVIEQVLMPRKPKM